MKTTDTQALVRAIVSQQRSIIGPLAIAQANMVRGLHVDENVSQIKCDRDGVDVLKDLLHQYEQLFGQASVEACKESVRQVMGNVDAKQIPSFLK